MSNFTVIKQFKYRALNNAEFLAFMKRWARMARKKRMTAEGVIFQDKTLLWSSV